MSPRKIILLLTFAALAIGNYAQAANVPTMDESEVREALHTCWTGGYGSVGFPQSIHSEFGQCLQIHSWGKSQDWLNAIETCAEHDEPYCVDMLAYIRQFWGAR